MYFIWGLYIHFRFHYEKKQGSTQLRMLPLRFHPYLQWNLTRLALDIRWAQPEVHV
jgi:hypothetical protein